MNTRTTLPLASVAGLGVDGVHFEDGFALDIAWAFHVDKGRVGEFKKLRADGEVMASGKAFELPTSS